MPQRPQQTRSKYRNQRKAVAVPVVSLAIARRMANKTLQEVCDYINNEFEIPRRVERGTISAIENGHRGASAEMLAAIASALGISPGDIDTQYVPRKSPRNESVA